jgi:hypothetical protein
MKGPARRFPASADQAADILDLAFVGREASRQDRVAKRRAGLKVVK